MNGRIRVIFSSMMIVLLALLSAFSVIPARADDGAPPAPTAPAAGSSDVASLNEAVPALVQVPAGTDVVVVDRSGHKVPLVSQEAAHIVAAGDPVWCPLGVTPGGATCSTKGNTSLQSVIDWLNLNNPAVAGVIWIEKNYVSSVNDSGFTDFTLDGSSVLLSNTANYSLTINGGWNGTGTGLDLNTPSTFDGDGLSIINWKNSVTLNNLLIQNSAGNGLVVTTTRNILLNNVDAVDNAGDGADLDNCYSNGTDCTGSGTVTVNFSNFNDNAGIGLDVYSNRTISLKNITAYANDLMGVYLDNSNSATPRPVTISGANNNFSSNLGTGIDILSDGAITMSNVTAYDNLGFGAYLDNCFFDDTVGGTDYCTGPGSYAVTLTGSNNFYSNGMDGLDVWASGAITVYNLTASENGIPLPSTNTWQGMGAYLNNWGAYAPKPITLNGTNTFTDNAAAGLWLDSWGAVRVNNLTASGNGLDPYCNPDWSCDGVQVEDSAAFTITGYGTFNGNGDDGLEASSWGSMSMTNLQADGNDWWGVYLDNTYGMPNARVTLSGTNVFTNNGDTGLTVYSFGVVTLNNVAASYNGAYGAQVDNCLDLGSGQCTVYVPKSVVFTGVNTFNGNSADGLWINSLGTIAARQVTANDNLGNGAYIDNQWEFKNYNIALTGSNVFNGNGGFGLQAYSNGVISMSNLSANDNTGDTAGAYLENKSTTLAPVYIVLTGTNTFNGNGNAVSSLGSGLVVYSDGAITISNLTADDNQQDGAYLNNWDYRHMNIPRNIILTGINTFVGNLSDGLYFNSSGSVSLNQLTSMWNGSDGVYGIAARNITINCGNLYQNTDSGYHLSSGMTVTLKGLYSYGNGPDVSTLPKVVTGSCLIP